MNATQPSLELETLRHRVRIAELLHKETKLKAQRMALQAAFYEKAYKQATAEKNGLTRPANTQEGGAA